MKKLTILLLVFVSCKAHQDVVGISSMDDLEYPYTVKKITVLDNIEIAYAEEGSGEQTLLFLHGLGSYLPAWKKNIEGLKSGYRCIAIDLPGYGKSEKKDFAYDMKFFADVVADFIKNKELKNVSIAGHSMGGQIAITFALYYPELLEKLILISPAGFETFTEGQKQWFRDVFTARLVQLTPAEAIQSNLGYNFYEMPDDAEFMISDRLAMRYAEDFEWYCYAVMKSVKGMINQPVFDHLKELSHPTLIMYGENDNLIPNRFLNSGFTKDVAEKGSNEIPNSTLQMIPKCGHFAQFEKSAEVNQAITTFMNN